MLREQDVIRNELLTRYEKRNEDITKEVSSKQFVELTVVTIIGAFVQLEFYKEQNNELIKRLDEFETSCIMDPENITVNEQTQVVSVLIGFVCVFPLDLLILVKCPQGDPKDAQGVERRPD